MVTDYNTLCNSINRQIVKERDGVWPYIEIFMSVTDKLSDIFE